jgi:hypothetical protein
MWGTTRGRIRRVCVCRRDKAFYPDRKDLPAAVKQKIKWIVDRISDYILDRDSHDIHRAMQRRALEDTSRFVEDYLLTVPCYEDKFALLAAALQAVSVKDGLFCEFGVHSGSTVNFIAQRAGGTVYGFDSFEGLPEDWRPGVEKGHFKMDALPRVLPNVELVKGWFNESLPGFLKAKPGQAAFLHIDCDLYSSTRTVFELMGGRIQTGTVLAFDEFFNYPGWRKGEYLALTELLTARCLRIEYLGYVRKNEQVAVRVLAEKDGGGPKSTA